jgi:hypothetical protein
MTKVKKSSQSKGVNNSDKVIGLLLVHGIGQQKPGDQLTKFAKGFKKAYPEVKTVSSSHDRTILHMNKNQIRVYEVYWADKLSGDAVKSSFQREILLEIAWFPYRNRRAGLLEKKFYPSWLVALWTLFLVPLCLLLYVGHWGATFLVLPFTAVKERGQIKEDIIQENGEKKRIVRIWEDIRNKADQGKEAGQNTILDRLMDEFIGDIFNYTASVEGLLSPDHPLCGVGQQIIEVFRKTAAHARAEGCSELQIIAHSLGTAVAYHGLTHYTDEEYEKLEQRYHGEKNTSMKISRLYTIGSPLEKIRFFWPKLFDSNPPLPAVFFNNTLVAAVSLSSNQEVQFRWDNFYSSYDIISGRLKRFQNWATIKNHDMPHLGGMATAHVRYESNPKFLTIVGEGLTGIPRKLKMRTGRLLFQIVTSSFEGLFVPLSLLVLVTIGIFVIVGMGWLIGKIWGFPFRLFGVDQYAEFIESFFVWFMLLGMTLLQAWVGFNRTAKKSKEKSSSN